MIREYNEAINQFDGASDRMWRVARENLYAARSTPNNNINSTPTGVPTGVGKKSSNESHRLQSTDYSVDNFIFERKLWEEYCLEQGVYPLPRTDMPQGLGNPHGNG